MLTKFISVSETCFQDTKTALKNQQASIQGFKTQIGQLAKLISERPQGSLPSNTESNPREQLNAIAIQDKEGLVAKPRPELVVNESKNENKLNTFPNQLKVGDKLLLDVADPHIVTAKLNEEIPLMVLSIFPFGTVEGKDFPSTGYDRSPRPCDMAVGKPAKTTLAGTFIHGRGRSEQRQTRSCDTAVCTSTPKGR
ncbi:hypothetical protein GOBAR_AA17721 [Gossypium barbadense]|uniref:Uncharacterized protein n=1 Tax=Gossypium barbadense TaxID=3634 RepID=A0A2P5XI25_GOSBA|nr:hypothetical protein GOBAR_AA17721 [Gossypium barbadense]